MKGGLDGVTHLNSMAPVPVEPQLNLDSQIQVTHPQPQGLIRLAGERPTLYQYSLSYLTRRDLEVERGIIFSSFFEDYKPKRVRG